jgi:hypothetical protein
VKRLFFVAVLIVAFCVLRFPTPALAKTDCEMTWDYYSDATFSTEVGGLDFLCTGARITWGTRTNYYHIYEGNSCPGCLGDNLTCCIGTDYWCADGTVTFPPILEGQPCGVS